MILETGCTISRWMGMILETGFPGGGVAAVRRLSGRRLRANTDMRRPHRLRLTFGRRRVVPAGWSRVPARSGCGQCEKIAGHNDSIGDWVPWSVGGAIRRRKNLPRVRRMRLVGPSGQPSAADVIFDPWLVDPSGKIGQPEGDCVPLRPLAGACARPQALARGHRRWRATTAACGRSRLGA